MKKFAIILSLTLSVILFTAAVEKVNKSAGPPSCHAGEPPNNTNCTNCHNDGVVNTGSADVWLDLGGADTEYIPGKTYTISISVSKPGMRRAGFQCIALQDDNDKISPGLFTLTDESRTQLLDKNAPHSGGCFEEDRVWIEHTYAGNSSNDSGISRWSYHWKAPANGVGSITFYLAALEANNDLTESGDHVYTLKKTITGLPVGIREVEAKEVFNIYPTPVTDELYLTLNNTIPKELKLYTATGKLIRVWYPDGMQIQQQTIKLSTADIPSGIYLLSVTTGSATSVQKVLIR